MNTISHISHDRLFSTFTMLPTVKSCIVIPVKNEEVRIENTLKSFLRQVDNLGNPLSPNEFEILILANNCSDNTVILIEDFALNHPLLNIHIVNIVLPLYQSNIGYVRRLLMECAYERLSINGGGIIMTTDGDTQIAEDWISQTRLEIENGAEAVGGRIHLCSEELKDMDEVLKSIHFIDEEYHLLAAQLESLILANPIDPSPSHHQHFNGSFAITTDCYARSGGVPKVPHLEDCAFYSKLQSIDAKIRHSNKVVVYTSARCIGRTPVGLSYQLNVWKQMEKNVEEIFVESCKSIFERITIKKALQTLWQSRQTIKFDIYSEVGKISTDLIFDNELYLYFYSSQFFGEWYDRFIAKESNIWSDKYPPVSIEIAISDLRNTIADLT